MAKLSILAVSGWKRSGKDTIANYLVENYGFQRLAFADPLKDSVAKEFGLTRAYIDDPATKEAPLLHMPVTPKDAFSLTLSKFMFKEFRSKDGRQAMNLVEIAGALLGEMGDGAVPEVLYWTPRALCILKGSSMRTADSDYWVKQALEKAKSGDLFVISDARYKNEMDVLKKFGGDAVLTARVNRFLTSPSNDPSERDLDDYTFEKVFDNSEGKSLTELFDAVDDLMAENGISLRK